MIKRWLTQRMLSMFRVVSRTSGWFESRFTTIGRVVLTSAAVALIFGIDPRQTLALIVAAVLFGISGTAMIASLFWRPRLSLKRVMPNTVTAENPASYVLYVSNDSNHIERDLVVADRLLTRYPRADEFRQELISADDNQVNWFDRRVGFPRWVRHLRFLRGARFEPVRLPTIAANASTKVEISFEPLRRGKLQFTEVDIKRPDPFGIFYAVRRIKLPDRIVALPKRYSLPTVQWVSERHFHRGGLTLAATVGESEEFMGLREYRPGDPLRHIHWRSFAKRGLPVVKEHEDEFFDRHALIFDRFIAQQSLHYFELAVSIAASLVHSGRPNDSLLDLVLIDQKLWRLTAGRGLSNTQQVLAQLAEITPSKNDDFEYLTAYMDRHLEQLASVVIVCSTWDRKREAFLAKLQQRHLQCVALRIGEAEPAEIASNEFVTVIRPQSVETDLAVALTNPL